MIAFEPDSLGTIDCHARSRRDDRVRLLRYGVDALSRLPNATIYLEAGASDWEPARRTAKQLRAIGIAKVRGFMLNATHYDWTRNNIRHGLEISRLTGGKHFVINTAENGRGPIHYRLANGRRITVWCNPPLRGLGTAADHGDLASQGGRLPVDQPARLRAVLPAPADRLVPAASAQLRALRDGLGGPAGRDTVWAPEAPLPESPGRPLEPTDTSSFRPSLGLAWPPLTVAVPAAVAMPTERPLRAWQRDAAAALAAHGGHSFLASATPAAGKTTFGLHVASEMLASGRVARVVVAGPTTHICRQWAADAARYRHRPRAEPPERRRVPSRATATAIAVTYQTIAAGPEGPRPRPPAAPRS